MLAVMAATVLAIESLVFIGVHARYREISPIVMSGVLGLVMAFVAYGRLMLAAIVLNGRPQTTISEAR